MAEPKRTFPMLPVAHWWALRKKFKQSIPGVISDSYLATVRNMGVNSARANVLPYLKTMGIIDEDGKTKERARLWRDDGHYPEVCEAILKDVYPEDLLSAVPDPKANREMAQRWFANHTGAGENACRKMASLYTVLVEADPASAPEPKASPPKPAKKTPKKTSLEQKQKADRSSGSPAETPVAKNTASATGPEININLQIHISADASPDQIEQIFAAMAKHIYQKK